MLKTVIRVQIARLPAHAAMRHFPIASTEAADGISLAGMIRRFPALEWDCLPNQPSVLVEMATEFIQLADYPEF